MISDAPTPETDELIPSQSFVDQTRLFDREWFVPLLEKSRELERRLVAALREKDEDEQLRNRMTDLLTRTANAPKGDPGPLRLHDWSRLPDMAAELKLASELAEVMLKQERERADQAEQRAERAWIPISERLPDSGSIVLALWDASKWDKHSGESPYTVAEYNGRLWHYPGNDEDDYSQPQFWMPLPEPPEAK